MVFIPFREMKIMKCQKSGFGANYCVSASIARYLARLDEQFFSCPVIFFRQRWLSP